MENGVDPDWNLYPRSLSKDNLTSASDQKYRTFPGVSSASLLTTLKSPEFSSHPSTRISQTITSADAPSPPPKSLNSGKYQEPDYFYTKHCAVSNRTDGLHVVTPDSERRPSNPSIKLNKKVNLSNHPIWTARNHLKTSRSVSSPFDNKSPTHIKPTSAVHSQALTGKPSVKTLLRRFDSSYDGGKGSLGTTIVHSKIHKQRPSGPRTIKSPRVETENPQPSNNCSKMTAVTRANKVQTTTDINIPLTSTSSQTLPTDFHRPLFGEVLPSADGKFKISHGVPRSSRSSSNPSSNSQGSHVRSSPFSPSAWYLGHVELHDLSRVHSLKRNNTDYTGYKSNQSNGTNSQVPTLQKSTSISLISLKNPMVNNNANNITPSSCSLDQIDSQDPDGHIVQLSSGSTPCYLQSVALNNTNSTHCPSPSQKCPFKILLPNSPHSHKKQRSLDCSPSQRMCGSELNKRHKEEVIQIQERESQNMLGLENVDFVARRETIHRAYTNRLKEDEQRQTCGEIALEDKPIFPAGSEDSEFVVNKDPTEEPTRTSMRPFSIDTKYLKPNVNVVTHKDDSPILGVPGSYIDYDEPLSAASNITEIENEPQTEALRLNEIESSTNSLLRSACGGNNSDSEKALSNDESFENNPVNNLPINEQNGLSSGPISINDLYIKDPYPPGAFHDEDTLVFASAHTLSSPCTPTSPTAPQDIDLTIQTVSPEVDDCPKNYIVDDDYSADSYGSSGASCLPDNFQFHIPDVPIAPPTRSDSGDEQTPLTEKFYEASESGVIYSEALNAMKLQALSRRSSCQTDCSGETRHEYSQQNIKTPEQSNLWIPEDEKPTPPPKSPELLPAVPPKPDGYSPLPSPCFPLSTNSPLLPPLATGENFAFTFSKIESVNQTTSSSHSWPPEHPPPPTFQRSISSPMHHHANHPGFVDVVSSKEAFEQLSDVRLIKNNVDSLQLPPATPRSATYPSMEDSDSFDSTNRYSNVLSETEDEKRLREENRKRLYQRKMAIKELIDTEAVYLKDMNVVEEIYKGTAEACPNLEVSDIKAIFRNTEEIVTFSNKLLEDLKLAAYPIYTPRRRKGRTSAPSCATTPTDSDRFSVAATLNDETEEQSDRKTYIGVCFCKHLSGMQVTYTNFLKNSETASSRLLDLQKDSAVKVWLSECNTVAKDLTAAWDLDALLVKPVQRITRYQLLLRQIQISTPDTHPDYDALTTCCQELSTLLKNIDDLKKRINMVAKIVGRKRKESDVVRTGIAKAFRRVEKQSANPIRLKDDEEYLKIFEKFGHDYLRLQVVLRDAEYYSRQVSTHVSDYLRYLTVIEEIVQMSKTCYPEIESKWTRFNVSMREMGTHLVEEHMSEVKKLVIEPFEKTISAYNGPLLAMKKRDKRKIDFDKAAALRAQGKKVDEKLQNLSSEYSALHETLKWELPKLSELTETMGIVILGNFISIQQKWYALWMDKVQSVLEENQLPTDIHEIIAQFQRDYKNNEARLLDLSIINGSFGSEYSLQAISSKSQSRRVSDVSNQAPSTLVESRRSSINLSGYRTSVHSTMPATSSSVLTPSCGETHGRVILNSPGDRLPRPNTGRSYNSESGLRASTDYSIYQRESLSARGSYHDGPPQFSRPQSGLFYSAILGGKNEGVNRSRASSRDRTVCGGYSVLYLAASLFEFNISATKQEAGYIYLTYQAGEIFDVIGENGELWLAKNQDDATNTVGWIWSKHFARLAAS